MGLIRDALFKLKTIQLTQENLNSLNESRVDKLWFYNKLQDLGQKYKLREISNQDALHLLDSYEDRLTDLFRSGDINRREMKELTVQINGYRDIVKK